MTIQRTFIVLISVMALIGFSPHPALSQGCSDAGVCTIPEMNAESNIAGMENLQAKNHAAAGLSFGVGEQDVSVTTPYLIYDRILNAKVSLSAKIIYSANSGDLGSQTGLGDIYLTGNFLAHQTDEMTVSITTGVKLPLSKADAGDQAVSLPMVYQSSLETVDFILGAAYAKGKVRISAGWQQPLSGDNSNSFHAATYPDVRATQYLSTNRFNRKGDVLLRVSYALRLAHGRIVVRPGILPIYHLGNDRYTDAAGVEQSISGSQGLTLNGNLNITWQASTKASLRLIFGAPFITRQARPDGLTRHMVTGLEYNVSF